MRSSPGDTPIEAGCWLFWADQDCGLHSDFSWSHLWSHSYRFRGVRSGLPSLGSGASRPNRTGLNHQPQNSKAREGKPSAGSNPAATASLTRPNAGPAATWAPAILAVVSNVVSNVVSIGPDWCVSVGPQEAVEAAGQGRGVRQYGVGDAAPGCRRARGCRSRPA